MIRKIQSHKTEPAYSLAVNNYKSKTISQIPEDIALDALFYGIKCAYLDGYEGQEGYLHISEKNDYILCFSNIIKKKTMPFKLIDIQKMTFNQKQEIFKVRDGFYCNMNIYIDKNYHDFIFYTQNDLEKIILALRILRSNKKNNDGCIDNQIDSIIHNLDQDGNNMLDDEELKTMAVQLGIRKEEIDEWKAELDKDGDRNISVEEAVKYFKQQINGSEVEPIFRKYASNPNYTMGINNVINFFHTEQGQDISQLDAAQIIIHSKAYIPDDLKENICSQIEYSYFTNNEQIILSDFIQITNKQNLSKIYQNQPTKNLYKSYNKVNEDKKSQFFSPNTPDIKLEMNLREFYQMLHSDLVSVYNKTKLDADLDTSHPLTDYYINSTHNTYLTGHQLYGQSSDKMYGLAVQKGYRLVELDCYDGSGDKIEIKHGFTLTSTIYLDEVLTELRNESFTSSPYPVILSIENHMDEYHQRIFAYKCKMILKDLYVFPYDKLPEYVPTLEEMKKKFILKLGKKKLYPDVKFVRRVLDSKEKDGKLIGIKQFGMQLPYAKKAVTDINLPNLSKEGNKEGNKETKKPSKFKTSAKPGNALNPEYLNKPEELDVNSVDLQKCIGLHGDKYKMDKIKNNVYRPWESCTIKCSVFEKLDDANRNYFIRATQNFVAKAYPEKFDSSNYNVCHVWMTGAQIAALNIQAYDDLFLLYNNIFFRQNNNCGYVMKPQKFLKEMKTEADFITYNIPKYKLRVQIYSVKYLGKLIETAEKDVKRSKDLKITVKTIGSNKDEGNYVYKYKLCDGVIFPKVVDNKAMEFDVYEEDLGALVFIINYDGDMVGRAVVPYCIMMEGYRRIPLFDNNCNEVSESLLVCHLSKIGNRRALTTNQTGNDLYANNLLNQSIGSTKNNYIGNVNNTSTQGHIGYSQNIAVRNNAFGDNVITLKKYHPGNNIY